MARGVGGMLRRLLCIPLGMPFELCIAKHFVSYSASNFADCLTGLFRIYCGGLPSTKLNGKVAGAKAQSG